jgi:hypothetical protein
METSLLVAIISIGTAVASFFLGLVVLGRNITNDVNYNFCIFAWLITGWEMLSYAFFMNQDNFELYKYSIAAGGACLLAITPWVIYIVKEKPNKYFVGAHYLLAVGLLTIPLWDKNTLYNFTNLGNTYMYDVGLSYYIYSGIVFLSVGYSFYLLIRNLFSRQGPERLRILFTLIGMLVYVCGELVFGVILPILKATPSIPFDNFGALFFVAFGAYAIMKFVPVDRLKSLI